VSADTLIALASRFSFERSGIDPAERARIEEAVHALERESPRPRVRELFHLLDGDWRCLFTDSPHVLGLRRVPLLRLGSVHQRIVVGSGHAEGGSFNIGELTRGSAVKVACGEYARLRPSADHEDRVDLEYAYFYAAHRILTPYEGTRALAESLVAGTLRGSLRLPFRKPGWQRYVHLDRRLRVLYGNNGGLFVLVRADD
jgi:hypothetical protein